MGAIRVADKRFGSAPSGALYGDLVTTQVIVLNGGSSSGKSGIARCLQAILPDPWLAVGDDMLIEAMPASMQASEAGIEFAADGTVSVGPEYRTLQAAWMEGVAAMAQAGARVIVDEIFLGGAVSQQRWQKVLAGLDVLWVAVRCDGAVAAGRELARGDRIQGMAVSQAEVVHRGVVYDLEVDTSHTEAPVCARTIAAHIA
jgi:chloramphenicol 3-O phosphotransferase